MALAYPHCDNTHLRTSVLGRSTCIVAWVGPAGNGRFRFARPPLGQSVRRPAACLNYGWLNSRSIASDFDKLSRVAFTPEPSESDGVSQAQKQQLDTEIGVESPVTTEFRASERLSTRLGHGRTGSITGSCLLGTGNGSCWNSHVPDKSVVRALTGGIQWR